MLMVSDALRERAVAGSRKGRVRERERGGKGAASLSLSLSCSFAAPPPFVIFLSFSIEL